MKVCYQANALDVRNDDVNGLAGDIEAMLGIDLEEVGAHESEDGDAVVEGVLGVGSRRLGKDQQCSCLRVGVLACSGDEKIKCSGHDSTLNTLLF